LRAQTWPNRPVRIAHGYDRRSNPDTVARTMSRDPVSVRDHGQAGFAAVDMLHVPFKGTSFLGRIGGRVDMRIAASANWRARRSWMVDARCNLNSHAVAAHGWQPSAVAAHGWQPREH